MDARDDFVEREYEILVGDQLGVEQWAAWKTIMKRLLMREYDIREEIEFLREKFRDIERCGICSNTLNGCDCAKTGRR